MGLFLSHFVNNIDAKGRVSIPGAFRQVMAQRGITEPFTMRSLTRPAMDVGGPELLERFETLMNEQHPLSDAYQDLTIFAYGDGAHLKVDAEGRLSVTDFIRTHTGIADKVAFVGAGRSFQLWEPGRFEAAREAARSDLAKALPVKRPSAGTPEQ